MVNITDSTISGSTNKQDSGKSFSIEVATLVTGTTLAQIVAIATAPIIARLYSADAFGLSAIFSSLVGIISVIACLRFDPAIMLPKKDEEASNLLALCIIISIIISLILVPFIFIFGNNIASLLNASALQPFLWLIPLMVFLNGSFSAINYWNTRRRQFNRLSITQITKVATTSGTQLSVGFSGYASGGNLIGASAVGQTFATSSLGYQMWKSDKEMLRKNVTWSRIKKMLNQYGDFPKFDVITALVNTFSLQMPIFILSAFFTTTIVGYYSLGLMVLQMPMVFIGNAIAQVFFQRAAEAKNLSKLALASIVEGTVGRLIVVGFLPLLLLSVLGGDLFTLVFGTKWEEAGIYAQILSLWILIQFVTSPLTYLFPVQNQLRADLIFQIFILISRIVPMILGGLIGDIYLTLILLSIFGALSYSLECIWLLKKTSVSISAIFRKISSSIMLGILVLIVVILSKYIFYLDIVIVVLIAIMGILVYFYEIFIKERQSTK